MSLGDLALIVAAGLAGPLLAASRRAFVPVVVGEIIAGVILGRSGLDVIHTDNATVSFLAEAGFAMLMLTVGMHVPLRDRRLRRALGRGALAAGVAAIAAPLGGLVVAELTGTGHVAVYAVLLASGSAAIVLPTLQERKLDGAEALVVIAQVTVADVAAILAVPLVLQPSRAANAAVGGLVITGCALIVFFVGRSLRPRPWVHRLRKRSKRRGWALDLRLSLAVLFALAWIAQQTGTSVLLGGFSMGLVVAGIGGPKRLSTQVRGVADTLTPDVAERLLAELTSRLVAVERDLVHFPISYSFSAGDPRFSLPVAAPYLLRIARRGMNEAQPTIVRFRARLLLQAIDDLAKTTATQFHGPGATTPEELLSG